MEPIKFFFPHDQMFVEHLLHQQFMTALQGCMFPWGTLVNIICGPKPHFMSFFMLCMVNRTEYKSSNLNLDI